MIASNSRLSAGVQAMITSTSLHPHHPLALSMDRQYYYQCDLMSYISSCHCITLFSILVTFSPTSSSVLNGLELLLPCSSMKSVHKIQQCSRNHYLSGFTPVLDFAYCLFCHLQNSIMFKSTEASLYAAFRTK
jgi:hypothetical protein